MMNVVTIRFITPSQLYSSISIRSDRINGATPICYVWVIGVIGMTGFAFAIFSCEVILRLGILLHKPFLLTVLSKCLHILFSYHQFTSRNVVTSCYFGAFSLIGIHLISCAGTSVHEVDATQTRRSVLKHVLRSRAQTQSKFMA